MLSRQAGDQLQNFSSLSDSESNGPGSSPLWSRPFTVSFPHPLPSPPVDHTNLPLLRYVPPFIALYSPQSLQAFPQTCRLLWPQKKVDSLHICISPSSPLNSNPSIIFSYVADQQMWTLFILCSNSQMSRQIPMEQPECLCSVEPLTNSPSLFPFLSISSQFLKSYFIWKHPRHHTHWGLKRISYHPSNSYKNKRG